MLRNLKKYISYKFFFGGADAKKTCGIHIRFSSYIEKAFWSCLIREKYSKLLKVGVTGSWGETWLVWKQTNDIYHTYVKIRSNATITIHLTQVLNPPSPPRHITKHHLETCSCCTSFNWSFCARQFPPYISSPQVTTWFIKFQVVDQVSASSCITWYNMSNIQPKRRGTPISTYQSSNVIWDSQLFCLLVIIIPKPYLLGPGYINHHGELSSG